MSSYATLLCIVEVKYLCKNVFGNVLFFFFHFLALKKIANNQIPLVSPPCMVVSKTQRM